MLISNNDVISKRLNDIMPHYKATKLTIRIANVIPNTPTIVYVS